MAIIDLTNVSSVIISQRSGSAKTLGAETPTIIDIDAGGYVTAVTGTTVPTDTTAGYAKNCVFIKTNATAGVSGRYENIGTTASCQFVVATTTVGNGAITRTQESTPAGSKIQEARPATIATTGNTDDSIIVGESGSLSSVDFSGVDALAASDTNYITFTITNLGQAGAGSNPMLAATAANTTQATGGTAISALTKRSLTLNGTGSNLVVVQGDRLLIRAAVTGTLANTVTVPRYTLRFSGTT